MDGTDLWAVTIELPRGSRIEYKFEVVAHGGRELVLDPFNPVLARDPFGANSVCQGAGYVRPAMDLPNPAPGPAACRRSQLESNVLSVAIVDFNVYLPARYRENSSYPLLVVHDGDDYMKFADLKTVLDNLIDALEIPAMVVALTQSPDRLKEYSGDERHARFLAGELLPFMQNHYSLIDRPEARGLMGASFGGVASLHTAWRYPQIFGNLFLQSGSFAFSDLGRHQRGPAFDPVVKFMNEFRKTPANQRTGFS